MPAEAVLKLVDALVAEHRVVLLGRLGSAGAAGTHAARSLHAGIARNSRPCIRTAVAPGLGIEKLDARTCVSRHAHT